MRKNSVPFYLLIVLQKARQAAEVFVMTGKHLKQEKKPNQKTMPKILQPK